MKRFERLSLFRTSSISGLFFKSSLYTKSKKMVATSKNVAVKTKEVAKQPVLALNVDTGGLEGIKNSFLESVVMCRLTEICLLYCRRTMQEKGLFRRAR